MPVHRWGEAHRWGEDGGGVQVDGEDVAQLGHEDEVHGDGELVECQVAILVQVRELPVRSS